MPPVHYAVPEVLKWRGKQRGLINGVPFGSSTMLPVDSDTRESTPKLSIFEIRVRLKQ